MVGLGSSLWCSGSKRKYLRTECFQHQDPCRVHNAWFYLYYHVMSRYSCSLNVSQAFVPLCFACAYQTTSVQHASQMLLEQQRDPWLNHSLSRCIFTSLCYEKRLAFLTSQCKVVFDVWVSDAVCGSEEFGHNGSVYRVASECRSEWSSSNLNIPCFHCLASSPSIRI